MITDNRKLSLIWEDILIEHGGEETVEILKNEYASYSIEHLLEFATSLLKLNTENHPCRYQVRIGDFLLSDQDTIVYSQNEIDYQDLLIALVTLMMLINVEQRPYLILDLAKSLREIDREVSDRFAKDLAEKVYRQYI
ncbi:hypothetical protein FQ087_06115 [Sporosarcina sp. ANT_H38]|uniref:hypothetical protein n=1 Tax=Sporosarcina sp. ANT_H38 TaxID=2597358 RepID=UPI0011F1743E|nr:hypothetical protein [Sporosarcina sp. ANT_H38]KAA0965839.1 hypothetical protein FQ087_06115 [Sporosarcina sp. ANT_H38]